jgi:hypothetical protein
VGPVDVSDFDIEKYLSSKGLTVKHSGSQLHTHCMFCNEDPGKRGRFYINNTHTEYHGLWDCKVCGTKGNLRTLMRFYGDSMEEAPVDERSMRITNAAANFYHSLLSPQHRETLYARGLTDETINKFRLGFAPGQGVLFEHLKDKFNTDEIVATGYCGVDRKSGEIYDFFRNEFTIPYLAHGIAQQIRGRAADPAVESNKYRTPPGGPVRLFNVDAAWSAETLIITEGEFDAMILDQLGFSAVGVPGATGWKASFLGYIKTAKRIWVMYDPDPDGQKNAVKVADALGARAMNVELPVPEGVEAKRVDPSYLVSSMGWEKKNFDDLLASMSRRASLLITPREALDQWTGLQGKDGVKLGFENLDHAIAPGLLAGQIMIPLAKTNTGKTLILLNIFQRASMIDPNLKILFLSLEQNSGDWFERARRIWNFYNIECEPWKVHEETVNYWEPRLRLVEKSRPSEEEFNQALDDYEDEMGEPPGLVAVDYLGYWAQGFKAKDRYEKVTDAVMALKQLAGDRKVPIISPHQVNRGAEFGAELQIDQARDSGAVEETADFAIGMWSPDTMKGVGTKNSPVEASGELVLRIGKSRHGGKGKEFRLQFGQLTLVFVPYEEADNRDKLKRELKWAESPTNTWEDAIDVHRNGGTIGVGL